MSIVTRTCHRCKVEQPIDQFYVEAEARAKVRRGKTLKMPCRGCQQRYQAERRAPRQAIVDQIKAESGCMDCGLHPEYSQVLEFDHRPDETKALSHLGPHGDGNSGRPHGRDSQVRHRVRQLPPRTDGHQEPVRPVTRGKPAPA